MSRRLSFYVMTPPACGHLPTSWGGIIVRRKAPLVFVETAFRCPAQNYMGRTPAEIQRAIASLQRRIVEHRAWIANLKSKIPNFRSKLIF
jgi:hypothetical protein